jgi:hypothetical protein
MKNGMEATICHHAVRESVGNGREYHGACVDARQSRGYRNKGFARRTETQQADWTGLVLSD